MKNILLIAPKSINSNSSEISLLKTPPSGLLILATMLRDKGHNVRFIDESFKTPDYDRIDNLDVILMSSIFPKNCLASVSVDVSNNDRLLKLMTDVSNFILVIGLESISQEGAVEGDHFEAILPGRKGTVPFHFFNSRLRRSQYQSTDLDRRQKGVVYALFEPGPRIL